ncbi:MAG: hypothetical protein JWO95_309 [Verrucomicrobiales bacterium]|nr:hypothetical protein [Verrucomicrobiales bacterium]
MRKFTLHETTAAPCRSLQPHSKSPLCEHEDIVLTLILSTTVGLAAVTSFSITPSATDPKIKTFTDPHWVYVNRDIIVEHTENLSQDRHELLVFLPGTGGKADGAKGFLNLAADLGYHAMNLMYPDDTPATVCRNDSNPQSFEKFRMAIIRGGNATYRDGQSKISIDPAESIENRLIKLLRLLQQKRPRENWEQFLTADGSLKWKSIAIAGQSQGGGHAALMGIKHPVARVICFGSPKDYNNRLNAPAAWHGEKSATPKSRFFAFNHHQDPKGCTPKQLLQNLDALGLSAFGSPTEVDAQPPPYNHARILYTSYPEVTVAGEVSDGAKIAHGSPVSTKNAIRWEGVWTYMLTESSQ